MGKNRPVLANVIEFPVPTVSDTGEGYMGHKKPENADKSGTPQKPKRGRPQKHGLTGTPTQRSYKAARERCCNPNHKQFNDYGGRGIRFLFNDLQDLVDAIGLRPEGTSLDRIDPDGDYQPLNVRWATRQEQNENRRSSTSYIAKAARQKAGVVVGQKRHWRDAGRLWRLEVERLNTGNLPPDLAVEHQRLCKDFKFQQPDPATGTDAIVEFSLPSMTQYGGQVRFRATNEAYLNPPSLNNDMLLSGLYNTPLSFNVGEYQQRVLKRVFDGEEPFLWVSATRNPLGKLKPVEGPLLSFFSNKGQGEKKLQMGTAMGGLSIDDLLGQSANIDIQPRTRLIPGHEFVRKLIRDGAAYSDTATLVIPDLQIGSDEKNTLPFEYRGPVIEHLNYRIENGLRTILVAEHVEYLGETIATMIAMNFREIPFDEFVRGAIENQQEDLSDDL